MKDQIEIRSALPVDAATIVEFNLRMAMETEDKRLDSDVLTSGVNAVLEDPARGFV